MTHTVYLQGRDNGYIDSSIEVAPSGDFNQTVWRKTIFLDVDSKRICTRSDIEMSPCESCMFNVNGDPVPAEVSRRIALCMPMAFNIIHQEMEKCGMTEVRVGG